jgi:hypothetical protein
VSDKAKIRELELRLNELAGEGEGGGRDIPTDFTPVVTATAPSASNQLRNGDLSHSVRTWNNGAVGNQDYECAHFFTHDAPSAAQQLDESTGFSDLNIDADANAATNKTLKSSSHASYSASYCDWDRATGQGRLQGTKTLDAPLPSNTAVAARTMCLALILALRSSRIVVPSGFRLFAGIWDNTAGQRNWLTAATAFTLSGAVRGTPGATTERRYKVFLYTDRDYTFISNEVTILAAPTDPSFSSTVDVYLSWDLIPGVLEAHVYRFNAVAGTYDLLEKTSSNTYADNGSKFQAGVVGYPAATDTYPKAYVATEDGALDSLAVDAVDAAWDSLFLNIPVPKLYNQSLTTDKQWLRIGQNMALDRRVMDAVVNNASTNIASATAAFTALDSARSVTLTDGLGNTHTTTVTYVNATNVTMAAAWPHASATGVTLYIVGGGDKGLLVDLIHISYVAGSAYAPYPEDLNRLLQPAAAPNGSNQGTVGGGGGSGSGEGGITCVEESEPVLVFEGELVRAVPFRDVRVGQSVFTGELRRSRVQKIIRGSGPLVRLEAENGVTLVCTPTHKVITTRSDTEGRAVERLRAGDSLMTVKRGRVEQTRVRAVVPLGRVGNVGTFKLAPGNVYAAGRLRRGLISQICDIAFLLYRRLLRRPEQPSGVLSHNRKTVE